MSNQNQHGGNLDAIERAYRIPKEKIIDFSGNVNPLGVPPSVKTAIIENIDLLSKYPDASYVALRKSIGAYTGVHPDNIIVGNGSSELIALFIKTLLKQVARHKKVLILSPAYSEYEREAAHSGLRCRPFPLLEQAGFSLDMSSLLNALDEGVGMFIACNPNNPTGSVIRTSEMEIILNRCASQNIAVLVDETYAEFSQNEQVSSVRLVEQHKNLFTVRGTSKFFAVPGLRLGYGLCSNRETIDAMDRHKDPWSVNALAEAAGNVMFSDTAYIQKTKELIFSERESMMRELKTWSKIKVYESQANFILIRLLENCGFSSADIFEKMIRHRLLIRDCGSFSFLDDRFIRFCILSPQENQLLLSQLKPLLL